MATPSVGASVRMHVSGRALLDADVVASGAARDAVAAVLAGRPLPPPPAHGVVPLPGELDARTRARAAAQEVVLTRIARVAAAASEQCYEEVLHCVVSHVWHAWSPAGALAAPAPFLQPRAVDAASSGAVPGWVGSDAQASVASSHMLNMTVLYTGFNVVDTTAIFQSLRARVEKTCTPFVVMLSSTDVAECTSLTQMVLRKLLRLDAMDRTTRLFRSLAGIPNADLSPDALHAQMAVTVRKLQKQYLAGHQAPVLSIRRWYADRRASLACMPELADAFHLGPPALANAATLASATGWCSANASASSKHAVLPAALAGGDAGVVVLLSDAELIEPGHMAQLMSDLAALNRATLTYEGALQGMGGAAAAEEGLPHSSVGTVRVPIHVVAGAFSTRAAFNHKLPAHCGRLLALQSLHCPPALAVIRSIQSKLFAWGELPLRLPQSVLEFLMERCLAHNLSVQWYLHALTTAVTLHFNGCKDFPFITDEAALAASGGGSGGNAALGGTPLLTRDVCSFLTLPFESLAIHTAPPAPADALRPDRMPVWRACAAAAQWLEDDEVQGLSTLPSTLRALRDHGSMEQVAVSMARVLRADAARAHMEVQALIRGAGVNGAAADAAAELPRVDLSAPLLYGSGGRAAATMMDDDDDVHSTAGSIADSVAGSTFDSSSTARDVHARIVIQHINDLVFPSPAPPEAAAPISPVSAAGSGYHAPSGRSTSPGAASPVSVGVPAVTARSVAAELPLVPVSEVEAMDLDSVTAAASMLSRGSAAVATRDAASSVSHDYEHALAHARRWGIAALLCRAALHRIAWFPTMCVLYTFLGRSPFSTAMGTAASAAACAQGAGADVAASLRDELYLMSLQSPLAADSKLSAQLNSAITNCRIDALARMLLDAVCIMSTGCMPISISETGALLPVAAAMATDAGASQNIQFRCVYAHTDVAPPAAVFARYLARAIELYRRCDAYARGQIGDDAASSTGSVAFVGASLQAMGQASHLSSKVRRRAMMETLQAAYKEPPIVSSLRANVLLFLNELLSHHSAPLSALPLAECATFQHGSLLKRLLSGSPRTDLRATLTTPHAFLPCTCCEMGTPHTTSASQDDAVLAFKLLRNRYAKCRYIDIQPFFALFRGVCGPAITAALADARKRLATEAAAAAVNGEPASPSRGAAKRGAKAGVDKRATPGVKRRRSGAAVDDERDPHADIDMATLIEQPEVMTAEAIVQARFWTALHELKHVGVLRYARKRAAVVEQVLFDETTMW